MDTAWGYKEDKNSYTILHDHVPSYLSGVIYLNRHKQKLLFPEINQAVNPEEGRFVIFSSFLTKVSAAEVLQVSSSSILLIGDNNRTYTVKIACTEISPDFEKRSVNWLIIASPRS